MTAKNNIDALKWLRKQVEDAPDPLRDVLGEMVNVLMQSEVTPCAAPGTRNARGIG